MTPDTVLLYDFDGLPAGDSGSTLLIMGPSVNYAPDDVSRVRAFLREGGRVVVMDDFGTAGGLLRDIDSPITIIHLALCQDVDYYMKPSFPVVSDINNSSLTANVGQLVFNHPAPLQVTGDAEVLARTTSIGWLDIDDNGGVSSGERFDSYPMIARASIGAGELFVFDDADLAINAMQGLGDNSVLTGNIQRSGAVYLDVGHGQQMPPLSRLYYAVKYDLFAQILLISIIFILGYAYVAFGRRFRRCEQETPRTDPKDALIASMKARLPLSDREIEELKKKL
jgi:hypothetical protein